MNASDAAHKITMLGHTAKVLMAAQRVIDLEGPVTDRSKYMDMARHAAHDINELLADADDALLLLRKLSEDHE